MGCDTLVALAPATRDGITVFAKNSDRPPRECQRVVQLPRRRHPRGARLRCQYIEVAQAPETAAVLGSQPYWLWGLEHGVNEHQVAIGNETVFTKEALGPSGLLGMDLVRIGLERGQSARAAVAVMTELVEAHGQGGSGHVGVEWPYHNGFLVADPTEAWILETSDRHWVARRVREAGNVSNGLALGTDWELAAADVTAFAVAQGWWPAGAGRVDFAAAYVDESGVPPNLCRERRSRAASLLAEGRGRLDATRLRGILRDHYDTGSVHRPRPFDDPRFFSLCMHADPLDNTTAAMVAPLPSEPTRSAAAWMCPGSPCVSAFVPCYLEGRVPAALAGGGERPDGSLWWDQRRLLELVEGDFARWTPVVRQRWDPFEEALTTEAITVEAEAESAFRSGHAEEGAAHLTAFMERTVDSYRRHLDDLIRTISAELPLR